MLSAMFQYFDITAVSCHIICENHSFVKTRETFNIDITNYILTLEGNPENSPSKDARRYGKGQTEAKTSETQMRRRRMKETPSGWHQRHPRCRRSRLAARRGRGIRWRYRTGSQSATMLSAYSSFSPTRVSHAIGNFLGLARRPTMKCQTFRLRLRRGEGPDIVSYFLKRADEPLNRANLFV